MAVLKKAAVFLVVFSFLYATTVFAAEDKLQTNDSQVGIAAQEKALASNVSTQEIPASQEEWNPPSAGPITTWTAPLCGKGKFVVQPFLFYNRTRGTFDSEGKYHGLDSGNKQYQYQEQIFMQYGITDRLEIDAQTTYQHNYLKDGDLKAHDAGLGDSYLFLRYCAFEEKGWMPDIDGLLQVKMPTGKYQHLDPNKKGTDSMGSGSWDPGIGVIMTKKLKPFILHADAIYSFPQGGPIDNDDIKTRYANYLNLDGGVEYFLPKGFNLMFEVNGLLQGDQWQDGSRSPGTTTQSLSICPGIGWSNDKIQTLIAYQRTLLGKNTDANDSLILTCVYTF